jgi:hypothetical protein
MDHQNIDDLREVAERFLREYLRESGSKAETVQPATRPEVTTDQIEVSHVIAREFVKEIRASRRHEHQVHRQAELDSAARIEIDANPSLVILCRLNHPRWLACPKRSVWAYAKEYAIALSFEEAVKIQKAFSVKGIESTLVEAAIQKRAAF